MHGSPLVISGCSQRTHLALCRCILSEYYRDGSKKKKQFSIELHRHCLHWQPRLHVQEPPAVLHGKPNIVPHQPVRRWIGQNPDSAWQNAKRRTNREIWHKYKIASTVSISSHAMVPRITSQKKNMRHPLSHITSFNFSFSSPSPPGRH